MKKQQQTYEPAEIRIVQFDRDLLIASGDVLGEGDWDTFDFGHL